MNKQKQPLTQQEWDALTRDQQVDYLMEIKQYNSITFDQVIEWYNRHLNDEGFRNPLTNKVMGKQPKSLDAGELHHACAMYRMLRKDLDKLGLTMDDYLKSYQKISYHYKDVWKVITTLLNEEDLGENDKTCPTSYTVLAHWGIIAKDKDKINILGNNGKTKFKGYWYLTNEGIMFLHNKLKLQKFMTVKTGKAFLSGEFIYFRECEIISYDQRLKYRNTNF